MSRAQAPADPDAPVSGVHSPTGERGVRSRGRGGFVCRPVRRGRGRSGAESIERRAVYMRKYFVKALARDLAKFELAKFELADAPSGQAWV